MRSSLLCVTLTLRRTFEQVCNGAATNTCAILRLRCRCDILSVHEICPSVYLFAVQHYPTVSRRSPQKGQWNVVRDSPDGVAFMSSHSDTTVINTGSRWRLSVDILLCQIDTRKSTATCTKATSWRLRHTSAVMSKLSKQAYSAVTLRPISRSSLQQRKRFFFLFFCGSLLTFGVVD